MRCIELRHYSRVPVPTSWQRISEPSAKTYKAAATAFLANTVSSQNKRWKEEILLQEISLFLLFLKWFIRIFLLQLVQRLPSALGFRFPMRRLALEGGPLKILTHEL